MKATIAIGVFWLPIIGQLKAADVKVPPQAAASGSQGVVAAGRQIAVETGLTILRDGGNAIDAAAAVILMQSVTESNPFCFGGEVPIIIYDARRDVVEVLSGQGAAPKLATLEYFQKNHAGQIPPGTVMAAAVPAVFHACLTAVERSGTMTVAQITKPMVRALDRDEPAWSVKLRRTILRAVQAETKSAGTREEGIRAARDFFYRGPIARELDQWSQKNDGLLRYEDLANHETFVEQPATIDYRGWTICKCGPWTQGPYLLQTLQLLDGYPLRSMEHNSADYIHVVTEAMKLGLADRDTYYADPRFENVPLAQLLSPKYAEKRRSLIDLKSASQIQRPGDPRALRASLDRGIRNNDSVTPGRDTTTCLVADKHGNVVAATPSGWGGVMAGDTGIQLGTRLISLNTFEGHPNCIAPGKRPRITLTPSMILRDGKPAFAISVAGGDLQDQTTLQVLLNMLEFEMSPAEAVNARRFSTEHHVGSFSQPAPKLGSLTLNVSVGEEVAKDLSARGHQINRTGGPIAAPIALSIDSRSGLMRVGAEPRAGRHAGGF